MVRTNESEWRSLAELPKFSAAREPYGLVHGICSEEVGTMGLSCREIRRELSNYIDNDISSETGGPLEDHRSYRGHCDRDHGRNTQRSRADCR